MMLRDPGVEPVGAQHLRAPQKGEIRQPRRKSYCTAHRANGTIAASGRVQPARKPYAETHLATVAGALQPFIVPFHALPLFRRESAAKLSPVCAKVNRLWCLAP